MIEKFAWAPMVPVELFDDKEMLYGAVLDQWAELLRDAGGTRMPGPIYMRVMEYGYINDESMEPVILDEYGMRVQYVTILITGPAMCP